MSSSAMRTKSRSSIQKQKQSSSNAHRCQSQSNQVHATRDGRFVYVANQGTKAQPSDTVSVIETATEMVVATIRTGAGAHGVTTSNDGRYMFVTNIVAGTVSAIDTESRTIVARFTVGQGPNDVSYKP